MIKKIVSNSSFVYILTRYITYGIQFINSILIAVYLGPLYLGIWGFINLVIQYLSQMNFGIAHSVNTIAAIDKDKEEYISKIVGNAIVIICLLSFLWGLIFFLNYIFGLNFGAKYNFSTYSISIFIIAILTYFNSLFSNILRIYNRISEIAICQSLLPLGILITILIYNNEDLLNALIWCYLITIFISFLIYILRFPIKVEINFNTKIWKIIQKKGWHLFIYNTSFYLILISTRSFVSYFYEVKEFGYFTFSFSLATVLILLLDSFTFLVWPKLLNRLAKLNNFDSNKLILNVRKLYTTTTHGFLHISICLFPYFLMLFPTYNQIFISFSLIALTIVLFTNSFGYQALLIARGKEKVIGILSFLILILNISICYVLVKFLLVSYEYVILATLISYLIYIIFLTVLGRQTLGLNLNINKIFYDIFPTNILIPFVISFFLVLIRVDYYYYLIPLLAFSIVNFKTLLEMKNILKKLVINPNFFEI